MADNGDILDLESLRDLLDPAGSSGPVPAPPRDLSAAEIAAFKAELTDLVEGRLSADREAAAMARVERSPYWLWTLRAIRHAADAVGAAASPIADRRTAIVDRVLTDLQASKAAVVESVPMATPSLGARIAAALRDTFAAFKQPAFAGAAAGFAALAIGLGTLGGGGGAYFDGEASITPHRLRTRAIEAVNRPLRAGDGFRVDFSLHRDAHVTLWNVDSKGAVSQIYPSKGSLRLIEGQYSVPGQGEWFVLDEQPGTETILIVAGPRPVDTRAFAAALARAWYVEGGLDMDKVEVAAASYGQRVQVKQFARD